MPSDVRPICRRVFDTAKLVAEFPPRLTHPNKHVVYRKSCPPDGVHSGEIVFSRWAKSSLPLALDSSSATTRLEARPDFFGYEPRMPESPVVEWYLNFAHSDLFCFYGGALFAQDEMQVTEHPALASVREALMRFGIKTLTVENGEPTPALVMGVERRCRIATDRHAVLGRPNGLYGNNFAAASAEAVARATEVISPPTISNVLALEAPPGGRGRYSRREIEFILLTAYSGFVAARAESSRDRVGPSEVVVHSGYWGCGAYGGNRTMMALLQVLAAQLAGLDRFVFHGGDAAGSRTFEEACRIARKVAGSGGEPRAVSEIVTDVESMGLQWGVGDGN